MESAINVLVSQFKTYAGKDGSANTLSKEEFQSLVTSQLPNFVKVSLLSYYSISYGLSTSYLYSTIQVYILKYKGPFRTHLVVYKIIYFKE